MIRVLVIFTILLNSLPVSALALEISFKAAAEVSSPFVTLGDIAVFDQKNPLSNALASQRISHAPAAGTTLTLDSRSVISKLESDLTQYDDVHWKGSPSILLKRTGITIGPDEIQSSIAAYLESQRQNLPQADYSFVPYDMPLPFMIPTGQLDLEVVSAKPGIIGTKRFSLIYKVDGKVVKNVSVRGDLKAMTQVAVLTQNAKRGTILHPNMVRMEKMDLSTLRTPCTDLREVLGKKLIKSQRTGTVLDLSSIDFPPLIKKGQLVKILLNHKELQITATGISTMNGKQDEIIRVKNIASQKMIFCRVIAPGLVEVRI